MPPNPFERYAGSSSQEQNPFERYSGRPSGRVDQATDIARSGASGAQQGVASIFGMGGDLQELNAQVGGVGLYWILRAQGRSDAEARAEVQSHIDSSRELRRNLSLQLPTTESVNQSFLNAEPESVREWTGHQPQTVAGEYARTAASFIPNAILPGGAGTRVARVVVPAAASETAGQLAREYAPELETPARIVAGVGGAIGTEAGISAVNRANAARAARRQAEWDAQAPARASEQRWSRMTAGERARDPAQMQREMELQRGGPAEAQSTLRDFRDQQANEFSNNLMNRVATRGLEPTTDSAGSAGTMFADELRDQWENMQIQQAERYDRAFELAQNERVSANEVANELLDNVNRVVDENFLDVPAAQSVVARLQRQISEGNATYGTVERARQQLNRLLGAAMRSGDDATAYGIRRIIDEVDAFVEPRLSGQARQAVAEARGFTREMLNQFDEQSRPELSTGQTGRRDPGGRVIRQIVDTDMTGEQVLDSIFGSSNRPPRAALAAVRRIRERATNTISSRGYEAQSAKEGQQVRTPGRPSLRGGRATRGGRAFDPTPAQQARFGPELPKTELQALREGFIYRLRRRLDGRNQGDGVAWGQVADDLDAAIDGAGREITETLFNPTELAELRAARDHARQMAQPSGSYMPSAPGIARDAAERSFWAILGRTAKGIPWIGESVGGAIESGIVNRRGIRDARAAVAPPQPPPAARRPTRSVPIGQAGAVATITSAGSAFYVKDPNGREYGPMTEGEAIALSGRINASRR